MFNLTGEAAEIFQNDWTGSLKIQSCIKGDLWSKISGQLVVNFFFFNWALSVSHYSKASFWKTSFSSSSSVITGCWIDSWWTCCFLSVCHVVYCPSVSQLCAVFKFLYISPTVLHSFYRENCFTSIELLSHISGICSWERARYTCVKKRTDLHRVPHQINSRTSSIVMMLHSASSVISVLLPWPIVN